MSATKTLNQLSSASSLASLSLIATDSQGNVRQVSPLMVPEGMYALTMSNVVKDFNEATSPGIYLLDGSITPANAPQGISTVCGMLEVFTRYTTAIFQRVTGIAGESATRCCFKGEWRPWVIH